MVEGTAIGVVTDIDGNYNISIPQDAETLVFSFIGFENQIIEVGGRSVINVMMQTSDLRLDEVVVVGYGTMKRSDLSGASISVGEDKIKGSVITNIDQALQGRAAGVTSMATSGAPGGSVSIRYVDKVPSMPMPSRFMWSMALFCKAAAPAVLLGSG